MSIGGGNIQLVSAQPVSTTKTNFNKQGKSMFIVFLKFSENKANASEYMNGHNKWLKDGFDAGTFVLAGSLQPKAGGAILAHNIPREALDHFLARDPFVENNVVSAEVHEISPGKADERLAFLMPTQN
jgi:uncharacterized protein YciI